MTTRQPSPAQESVRSLIPARIDRLPWSPFHTRMVVALGTCWVLDGLEITIASNVGEYPAINPAIDELIPARYRGQTDIAVNGTYWAGAAIAAAIQVPLLSGAIRPGLDWRIAFLIGPVLAIVIVVLRRAVPESPRW